MFACCTTRGDSEDGGGLCYGGRGSPLPGAASPSSLPNGGAADGHNEHRSAEVMHRHVAAAGSEPNLLLYSIGELPPPPRGAFTEANSSPSACPRGGGGDGPRRVQRACHVPPNTVEGVPIETECFVGKTLVMYRQHAPGNESPHRSYFDRRKRNWEVRVQGRFKRIPEGDMFIGIVLRDFNYDQAVARHSIIVKTAGMSLIKYDLYLSWGDRCEASKKPDAELSHLVTGMSAWDQIIITPKGRQAPDLNAELQELGDSHGRNLERSKLGLATYSEEVEEAFRNISTEDTYTMCFWGVSQVIDLLCWQFKIGYSISMARFFEDSPIHVAMYELLRPEGGQGGEERDKRHLESLKRYYLDFMFWSNSVECPALPSRYVFADAPEELERFAASANGGRSPVAPEAGREPPRRSISPGSEGSYRSAGSAPSRRSLLAAWTQRLRWIPDYTCAAHDGVLHHQAVAPPVSEASPSSSRGARSPCRGQ